MNERILRGEKVALYFGDTLLLVEAARMSHSTVLLLCRIPGNKNKYRPVPKLIKQKYIAFYIAKFLLKLKTYS